MPTKVQNRSSSGTAGSNSTRQRGALGHIWQYGKQRLDTMREFAAKGNRVTDYQKLQRYQEIEGNTLDNIRNKGAWHKRFIDFFFGRSTKELMTELEDQAPADQDKGEFLKGKISGLRAMHWLSMVNNGSLSLGMLNWQSPIHFLFSLPLTVLPFGIDGAGGHIMSKIFRVKDPSQREMLSVIGPSALWWLLPHLQGLTSAAANMFTGGGKEAQMQPDMAMA